MATERAVTHDEVAAYSDTAVLFKSNLFKLQQTELLKEVSPFGGAPLTRLESALRVLREELMSLPSTELSWERGTASHAHLAHLTLANESVRFTWAPPSAVGVAGSYLLRTCTLPQLNIDIAIQLPPSALLEKVPLSSCFFFWQLMRRSSR